MKEEEQRIAIAEACGVKTRYFKAWFNNHGRPDFSIYETREGAERGPFNGGKIEEFFNFGRIPDYLGSLDAMHEAEKVLDGETIANEPPHLTQYDRYLIALDDITPDSVRATAPQRAEALLRTLDLWKP